MGDPGYGWLEKQYATVASVPDFPAIDARWAETGVRPRWIGLEAHGGAPLPAAAPSGALVLALGAERGRLGAEVEARLDERWTIPLAPGVESLNVAVAAGVVLFALGRSRGR